VTVLSKVWKALAAGVSAGVGAYVVANQIGGVTGEEWGGIIGALLFAAVATYFAPANKQ
jgi:hypothetical protein